MRRFQILTVLALAVALPVAGAAQVCTETASVGPFTVDFVGASFDGTDTEFEYCISTDTFLNEWKLFLDPTCIDRTTVTDCSSSPCGWDDILFGVPGILFDDLDVGPGESQCFTFSMEGDWTGHLGDVGIRLKNDRSGPRITDICGPICRTCLADLDLRVTASETTVRLRVVHNKPQTVESGVKLTVYDHRGKRVKRWKSDRFTLVNGEMIDFISTVPGKALRPGSYELKVELKGMSGWRELWADFQVEDK